MHFTGKALGRSLFCAGILLALTYVLWPRNPEFPDLPAELVTEAQTLYRQHYRRTPDHWDTLSMSAELATRRKQWELAARCFEQIPIDQPLYGVSARFQQSQVLIKLDQAARAEQQLLQYLAQPGIDFADEAQQFLRYLLEIQLRFEERHQLLAAIHAKHRLNPADALFYGFSSLLRWNGEVAVDRCQQFYKQDPDNPLLRIAWAQYLGGTARTDEGLELIGTVLSHAPQNSKALAVKLYLLSEAGQLDELSRQCDALPAPTAADPWLMLRIRGQNALQRNNLELAEHCLNLYVQNDPSLTECYVGLAQIARKRGQSDRADALLEKTRLLALIQNRLGGAQFAPDDASPYVTLADQSLTIGLHLQARLMAESALQIDPHNPRALSILKEVQP